MRRPYLPVVLASFSVAFAFGSLGCSKSDSGGGGGGGGTSAKPQDISAMPKVTGKVVASALSYQGKSSKKQNFRATTGFKLKDFNAGLLDWGAGTSRAACESASTVSSMITQAVLPDAMVCVLGVLDKHGIIKDTYDGNYHYAQLPENQRLRYRVVKSGDAIDSFEMAGCDSMDNGATYTPTIYIGEKFDMSGAKIVLAVGMESSGEGYSYSFGLRSEVNGTVNSAGDWTSKRLSSLFDMNFTGGGESDFSFTDYGELTQSVDTFAIGGISAGSFGGSSYVREVSAIIQGLNMDDPKTFALGDGTSSYKVTFDGEVYTETSSWLGDTRAKLEDPEAGDYYSTLATVPGVPQIPSTPIFAEGEKWEECGSEVLEAGDLVAIDYSSVQAEIQQCSEKYALGNNNYIECYNAD